MEKAVVKGLQTHTSLTFRATQVCLHFQIHFMINQSNIIIPSNETLYHTVAVCA